MLSSVLAVIFSAAALVSADCARTYTVQEGDYCDLISAANNASTYQLAVANYQTINDGCTNLEAGESLCLGITGQDCQAVYQVKEGDSCDAIATQFGLNSTFLLSNNPQIDEACDNIYVGEVLCVSQSSLVTPAPAGWTLPGSSLDDGSAVTTTTTAAATTTTAPSTTTLAPADNAATGPTTTTSAAPADSTDDADDCDDGDDGTDDTDDTADDDSDDCDDQ